MGLFITIEGGDGSGKGTQSELLEKVLRNKYKKDVLKISFPRHGQPSAYYVGKFLNGEYGGINDVHPDLASLPYALDRHAASQEIVDHLKRPNSIVISDRYLGSNLAHNGSKFRNQKERLEYYERQMETELGILKIPKPELNIVLLVDTEVAQKNVDKKAPRTYTTKKRDIHEADPKHLDHTKAAYQELCKLYPDFYTAINCMESGKMRSIEAIHSDILELVLQR